MPCGRDLQRGDIWGDGDDNNSIIFDVCLEDG
jgi:hypothetical protein